MKTRTAVAFEAKKPLEIVEPDLKGPKAGDVYEHASSTASTAMTFAAFVPEHIAWHARQLAC